ncbi:MAG: sortase [Chloroflexi bacterium]|nr:sortase [Chloroflexota bacterium]
MLHRRLALAALLSLAVALPSAGAPRVATGVASPAGAGSPPATLAGPSPVDAGGATQATLTRVGTFRFPAIGLARAVYRWGCRGGTLPDLVVRWDCAGTGNTYLLGHAWGVFAPLADARRDGRLRRGQVAYLADTSGTVRRYELAWFKIVPATYVWHGYPGHVWAWNATSRRAVTLQTCWGAGSAYRLIVRFYETAG